MKLKFLLFTMLLSCGILSAQDTIKSLIITEARIAPAPNAYMELTNMGDETINLSDFEIGLVRPWTSLQEDGDWFNIEGEDRWMMLPDTELQPGESWTIGMVEDYRRVQYEKNPIENGYRASKDDLIQYLDYQMHYQDAPKADTPGDSISEDANLLTVWNGRSCWYVRHHISETDSVVIDQVGGVFDDTNGNNKAQAYDVAGMTDATNNAVLVRKFSVKEGNIDFATGRGVDITDSEWMPIPFQGGDAGYRKAYWSVDNHGNYTIDETNLTSSTLDIDWDNMVINVPWGVRRGDSLIMEFDKRGGLAWGYKHSSIPVDSSFLSCRTGDTLILYGLGNDLQEEHFHVEVAAPTDDANMVVPKRAPNSQGYYGGMHMRSGFCQATVGAPGMDTIKSMNGITGIGFATRVDSLVKYLDFPANATYEFDFAGDVEERADLVDGDILRVTAENGDVKEYYIKVDVYRPSHNAYLSAITWPDIPDGLKDIFGWNGDTIPSFNQQKFSYSVTMRPTISNVPAMVGHKVDLNTNIELSRATTLGGPLETRTMTFTVAAEDDTTINEYKVVLSREKAEENVQPFVAEPFISQHVFRESFSNNFWEICNPGNKELDLSNYMFFFGYVNEPATAISEVPGEYVNRYRKYIPGMKWQSEDDFTTEPYIAVQDLAVNPIVLPNDVFVMTARRSPEEDGENYPARGEWDIDFANNPWNEEVNANENAAEGWTGANYYMFKILNDSVREGTKPATDPADFELIEVWGTGDDQAPNPTGEGFSQVRDFKRKPQYWQPKSEWGASYADNPEDSEWIQKHESDYQAEGLPWPDWRLAVVTGIGSHVLNEITVYKSTVTSLNYLVSEGYSMEEDIRGVVDGTSVADMLGLINKANAGQTLTVKSGDDGSELAETDNPANGDTLVVVSANGENTSKYILEVTADGLSDDALLTSDTYTVTVDGDVGTITDIEVGTLLKNVVAAVTVPDGAVMTVIDDNGFYVPMKKLNYDTNYVDAKVNDAINFYVVAEDGATAINYELTLNVAASDAFIISDVYEVDQEQGLIDLIPGGTTVPTLMSNVYPVTGATVVLNDKNGDLRQIGNIYKDDRLVVTAADQITTKTYYLAMLGDVADYLAFILSDVYTIDQDDVSVTGVMENSSVADFIGNLTVAPGAVIVILDSEGNEKANADMITENDVVRVTSADETNVVDYVIIELVSSVNPLTNVRHSIYPNPTTGMVIVEGLKAGNKIQIFNSAGVYLRAMIANNTSETISLESEPRGMYFVIVSDQSQVIGRYKLLVE